MSKHKNRNRAEYIHEETPEIDLTEVEPIAPPAETEPVMGIVTGCKKLNIRKAPSKTAEVVDVWDEGDQFMLDLDNSTSEWYKITTETGVEGFCMKQYVVVK